MSGWIIVSADPVTGSTLTQLLHPLHTSLLRLSLWIRYGGRGNYYTACGGGVDNKQP